MVRVPGDMSPVPVLAGTGSEPRHGYAGTSRVLGLGRHMHVRTRFLTLGVASSLALSGTLVAVTPSGAMTAPARAVSTAPVAIASSVSARLPRGAARLGPVAPASKLHLDVTLKVRDQAALKAFLADLSNRQSPLFHRFLRPGQFGPRFGPTLAAIAAVRAALRQARLSPGAVSANRLYIPVTASAAAIERAFGISLVQYRMPGGRVAYANSAAPKIAGSAARYVSGVLGLDNLYQDQSQMVRPSPRKSGHQALALSKPDAAGPQPDRKSVV